MNSDADGYVNGAGARQNLKAGTDGPLCIVFVRRRIAEVCEYAIAQILGEVPVIFLNDFATERLVAGVELMQILRIQPFRNRRGSGNVREEDGDLSPLGNRRLERVTATAARFRIARIAESTFRTRFRHRRTAFGT